MKIIDDKKTTFDLEIIDLTEEGDGVGKRDGFTWFVRGGLPGDKVKCHVNKVNKHFGKADAVALIKPSKDRVAPECIYFDRCGGCQIQDMAYDAQLRHKKDMVYNVLRRIGGFEAPCVRDTMGMKDPYRFRNKGAYAVRSISGEVALGFYEKQSHRLVSVEDCIVQKENHKSILKAFKAYMSAFNIMPYNARSREGLVKHLVIKQSESTGEIMVIVVTSKRKLTMTDKMVTLLREAEPAITSVVQNIQPAHTSEILGEDCKILFGNDHIVDEMGTLKFRISPLSFYQVNSKQAKRLYDTALVAADLEGHETVFDLYCGTGTLSLFLAQKAQKVYGVELSSQAIEDSKNNAAFNNCTNAEFVLGHSEIEAPKLYAEGIEADVVVLDPPRSGCEKAVLDCILDMMPKKVVYVSCKPSTMARDLKILCESGEFQLEWVQPVDMFGHSTGVECVAKLNRTV